MQRQFLSLRPRTPPSERGWLKIKPQQKPATHPYTLLASCGIPGEVVSSDRRLVYVLFHGYDPVTEWDESWVSATQAFELLSVLERDLSSTSAYELISDLKRWVNRKSG